MAFGPADSIAPDVIGEVFFVHERGRAIVGVLPLDVRLTILT